jgi:sirohydrochlorin ferrochelatase
VLPGYASAVGPTVPQALRALAAQGCHRIAIASYFTAPGHFATSSALAVQRTSGLRTSAAPTARPPIVAAPLGAHPAMARLLLQRYDETVSAPDERPDEWSAPYATRARPSA